MGVWAKGSDQARPPAPGQAPPPNAAAPASGSKVPPVDTKADEEYGKGVVFYLSPEKRIGEFISQSCLTVSGVYLRIDTHDSWSVDVECFR